MEKSNLPAAIRQQQQQQPQQQQKLLYFIFHLQFIHYCDYYYYSARYSSGVFFSLSIYFFYHLFVCYFCLFITARLFCKQCIISRKMMETYSRREQQQQQRQLLNFNYCKSCKGKRCETVPDACGNPVAKRTLRFFRARATHSLTLSSSKFLVDAVDCCTSVSQHHFPLRFHVPFGTSSFVWPRRSNALRNRMRCAIVHTNCIFSPRMTCAPFFFLSLFSSLNLKWNNLLAFCTSPTHEAKVIHISVDFSKYSSTVRERHVPLPSICPSA